MSLREAIEIQQNVPGIWWSLMGPTCLGQYTLKNQTSAFALAKLEVHLRSATEEEALQDFDRFGDQVTGKEIDGKAPADQTSFPFLDSRFLYTGPPRLVAVRFYIHTEAGPCPDTQKMKELVNQVESLVDKESPIAWSNAVVDDGYWFIFTDKGSILISRFNEIGNYALERCQLLGRMEETGNQLLFLPEPDGDPINFTVANYRP